MAENKNIGNKPPEENKNIGNTVNIEDPEYKKILTIFSSLSNTGSSINIDNTKKILKKLDKIGKNPSYQINSKKVFDEVSKTANTVFEITNLSHISGDYTKYNSSDLIDYDDFIDIKKEGQEYYIILKKIDLSRYNKTLLKKQLYFKIYLKILETGIKYGIKDIDSIIDEYFNSIISNKKNSSKKGYFFERIIVGPDLIKQNDIKFIKIEKKFNKDFVNKLDSYCLNIGEIKKSKAYNGYLETYNLIIDSYKKELSAEFELYKKYIDILERKEDKIIREVDLLNDLKEKSKIVLQKIENIEYLLYESGIDKFTKELKSVYLEKKDKIINELKKISGDASKKEKKQKLELISNFLDIQVEEVYKYKKLYEVYQDENNILSQYVNKGENILTILFNQDIVLFDTDGKKIDQPTLKILKLFNRDTDDFEVKITNIGVVITAKKSGFLIDSFVDGKLNLEINDTIIKDFDLSIDYDNVDDTLKDYKLDTYINTTFDDFGDETLSIDKSFGGKLIKEGKDNNLKVFISENCNFDHIEGYCVFGQNIRIGKIDEKILREDINDNQSKILNQHIYGEDINIKYLENSNEVINIISQEYINLLLLMKDQENHIKDNLFLGKDFNNIDEGISNFDINSLEFLDTKKFLSKVGKELKDINDYINTYNNKKKRMVGLFLDVNSEIKTDINKENIFNNIYKKILLEIKKVKEKNQLLNNEDSMKSFIEKLFLNLDKEQEYILGKGNIIKMKKVFLLITELFFSSIKIREKLYKRNLLNIYLEKINKGEVKGEINIEYNIGENTKIELNGIKYEGKDFLYLPKGIGIKVKIENGEPILEITKTLDDLIYKKIELIPNEYFSSINNKKYSSLSQKEKKEIQDFKDILKNNLYENILKTIVSTKDLIELEKQDNYKNIFSKYILNEIEGSRKKFEKRNGF